MVNCCIVGCNNRSDRGPAFRRNLCPKRDGEHNVSFYRIPAIIRDRNQLELDLSTRRRDGFLAAISRKDLDMNDLGKYRVCSNHFVSGEPSTVPIVIGFLQLGWGITKLCFLQRPSQRDMKEPNDETKSKE